MNSNVLLALETRRQKNDGTYPLVLRLGHKRSSTTILLGINLLEKDWDVESRMIKKSYRGTSSVERLNNFIQKRKNDAMDILLALHERDKLYNLTLAEVRQKIEPDNTPSAFFPFTKELIAELKTSNRIGTAKAYQNIMDVLRTFKGSEKLSFGDITYTFLAKFEVHHLAKGNSLNGLAAYMRSLRAIYNKAIKAGVIEKNNYPFDSYKIRTTPTEKRALDVEHLKSIIDTDLLPGHPLFNARNYFVASYMMYGMNFTDMAFLKKADLMNGRIYYRRKKTSKLYDIKITDSLLKILTHYLQKNPESDYVFPIIKREGALLQDRDIRWAIMRYNKKLKALGEMCEIEQNLTSYVSRHSFATQAMLKDVPLNAISSMLGHSSLKTTEIYLKSLPSDILDHFNQKILFGKA